FVPLPAANLRGLVAQQVRGWKRNERGHRSSFADVRALAVDRRDRCALRGAVVPTGGSYDTKDGAWATGRPTIRHNITRRTYSCAAIGGPTVTSAAPVRPGAPRSYATT